jgi:hypothetical protein
LRHFIEAITEGIKAKATFEWATWIEIANWITEQPVRSDSNTHASEESSENPDWSLARNSVVRLLDAAISSEPGIPFSYSDSIIALLENLSSGFDPSADREISSESDPLQIGINTTRGAAIETSVRYAYWVRKNAPADGGVRLARFWSLMERRLDATREVAPIYAVVGSVVPMLTELNEQWVRDHGDQLFPRSPTSIWKAAWDSFVCYTRPYPKSFRVLRDVYRYAVSQIESAPKGPTSRRDPREAVGMHLINLFWFGELQLDDPLLTQFYERTPAYILGQLTREIARVFSQETQIRPEVLQRLMALSDKRLEIASSRTLPASIKRAMEEEIVWFASWFEIAALPADWRLERLGRVLRLVRRIDAHNINVDRLAKEIPMYLAAVVSCFKLLSEKLPQDAYLSSERDAGKAILRAGLQSTDPNIHDDAEEARDNLLLAGRFEFMQLGG